MRSAVFILVSLLCAACPSAGEAQWLKAEYPHYDIFYSAGSEKDVEFTTAVLNHADDVLKSKYGVTLDRYHISFYLYPEPTANATVNQAQNQCCTRGDNGISLGSIHYLAPSALAWRASPFRSSLGILKSDENYHAKVMASEYMTVGHYAVQDGRPSGGWRYHSAPNWFVQGLQEYDAIFHSTDFNRDVTARRLLAWGRDHPETFTCCAPTFAIDDDYNGGANFIAFLASEFGEGIHARLLRNGAPTFEAALANETAPYSFRELFDRFRKWLGSGRP